MKKFALLAVLGASLTSMSTNAWAADATDPAYDWSGPYAGVHAGYLWGDVDVGENGLPVAAGTVKGFVGHYGDSAFISQ